jgi:UV DNA damage endonuclease
MYIGYACLSIEPSLPKYKSCILKNATPEKLIDLIGHNLSVLEKQLEYNVKNHIKLFRMTSDLIPFGSSEINNIQWESFFKEQWDRLSRLIDHSGMRVSMHPGQYSVLNSPNEDVVYNTILDLTYHQRVLDALQTSNQSKIILHIGGVYNEKEVAMERFVANFKKLDRKIKNRIAIENDDKSYTVEDVLGISSQTGTPVVFDTLHHEVNPPQSQKDLYEWMDLCRVTWKKQDGVQKIHYSQQAKGKNPGAHSDTIYIEEFLEFYKGMPDLGRDMMLEVKDKNLSAIKCMNLVDSNRQINVLEKEWALYKYNVLEHAPNHYKAIRELLKDKRAYPAQMFYILLEEALEKQIVSGDAVNAALHVWGYFKNKVTQSEKKIFQQKIEAFKNGQGKLDAIKNYLWKLTLKYQEKYLLASYYFVR